MGREPGTPGGQEIAVSVESVGGTEGDRGEGSPIVADLGEGTGETDREFVGVRQLGDHAEG